MACLADATAFVEEFCLQHGIGRADALRLTLVVEELFTNTVEHGHGGDCEAPVRLEIGATATELTLRYDDTAPAFDVLAQGAVDLDAPVGTRRVGGLGLHLVGALAAGVRYAREEGCNRVWVVLRREA